MGGYQSQSVESVKAESFQLKSVSQHSMSLVNLYIPSSDGGPMLILVILGLSCLGYGATRLKDRRRRLAGEQ